MGRERTAGLYQIFFTAPGPRLMPPTGISCQFLTASSHPGDCGAHVTGEHVHQPERRTCAWKAELHPAALHAGRDRHAQPRHSTRQQAEVQRKVGWLTHCKKNSVVCMVTFTTLLR